MLDDCLGSLEETSKSDFDSNVSQVHSQVSADEKQPESLPVRSSNHSATKTQIVSEG